VNQRTRDSVPANEAGELHLHPAGTEQWTGIVYFDGIKRGEINPTPSIDAVKREASERFGTNLELLVWSRDAGMILSEG
jgi:hypothetical protein